MSVALELEEWGAALEAEVGVRVTRDPDLIAPPCIILNPPEAVASPAGVLLLEMEVWLLGPGGVKQATDYCLDHLGALLDATGQTLAQPGTYTSGEVTYLGYQTTVTVRTTTT